MTRDEILILLRQHKEELKTRFGIEQLALFGSYARDEATRNSDVDLAIMKMGRTDLWKMAEAMQYLRTLLNKKVDLGKFDSFRPYVRQRVEKELIDVF